VAPDASLVPERLSLGPRWLIPVAEAILLIGILVSDPGRIDRRSASMRVLSIGLLAVFIVGDVGMTTALIADLVRGAAELNNAQSLLATGALVWVNNNVLFGLLYWELDGGGLAARVFSPTDVMPCARWAKVEMALQPLLSLAVLSLVIARAVNIFS
jgi:hypothetical protein